MQDPLQQYHSPYVFCGNNPIRLVDLNGMEARDSTNVMIPPVIVYPSEDSESNNNSGYWGATYDLLMPGYATWMEAETYRINGEYGHAAARYLLSTFEAGLFFSRQVKAIVCELECKAVELQQTQQNYLADQL